MVFDLQERERRAENIWTYVLIIRAPLLHVTKKQVRFALLFSSAEIQKTKPALSVNKCLFFCSLRDWTHTHTQKRDLNLDLSNNVLHTPQGNDPDSDHFQFSHIWTSYWSLPGAQVQICIHIYTHLKKEERRKHTQWGSKNILLVCTQSHVTYRQWTCVDSQEIFITCTTLMYSAFALELGRRCTSDASYHCRQPCPMNVPLQGQIY